jgi:FkbM family methyltransferase
MLRHNIELNEYQDRVEVKEAALGGGSGTADFFEFEGDQSSWSSFAPPWNHGSKITVAVTTLDQSVPSTLLNRVRLVKLDLEGAEAAALAGAERLLEACDNFIVEVEDGHLRRQGATAEDILRIFRDSGFAAAAIGGGPNVHFYRLR